MKNAKPCVRGTWLIFADNSGLGQELATLLTTQNKEYILVFPSQEYQRNSQHFQINPTNSTHFQQLLEDLAEKKHNLIWQITGGL